MRSTLPALLCAVLLAGAAHAAAPREMGLLPAPKGDILGHKNPGDVPDLPANGELVVQKIRPADCRMGLGFVHLPVDGRIDSWGYNGVVNEYCNSQGYMDNQWQCILYEYLKEPGLHVTLADGKGFNYMYLRGGFLGKIYTGVDSIEGPGNGTLLLESKDSTGPEGKNHFRMKRVAFADPVSAGKISFYRGEHEDELLADVAFMRIGTAAVPETYTSKVDFHIGAPATELAPLGPDFRRVPAETPEEQHPSTFERRFFREQDHTVHMLAERADKPVALAASQQVHLLTPVLAEGLPVGAVRLDLNLTGVPDGNLVMLEVQDPLTAGSNLLRIDVRMPKAGPVRCLLDFPDQLTAKGRRFWITIASQHAGTLEADSTVSLLTVDPKVARQEHLAYRLFMTKGMFYVLSESRPFLQKGLRALGGFTVDTLEKYGGGEWNVQRLRPSMLDMMRTIEHLVDIAPDHPIAAHQYYAWLTRQNHKDHVKEIKNLPNFKAELPKYPGVPAWAVMLDYTAKRVVDVPKWWLANRMAPNGELGGTLGDDTDMVQWWVVPAMLDSEGFAPVCRDIFSRMSKPLLAHTLRDGVNIRVTDPLHAYEEGQNHMALMPMLFYGDPRYVEWLMTSAKTVERWFTRDENGMLRWTSENFGWSVAEKPPAERPKKVSSNSALLMHSHLMLAWYNRLPHAVKTLTEYCDAYGPYVDGAYRAAPSVSFGAYWITGDPKYLGLPDPNGKGRNDPMRWAHRQPDFAVHAKEAHAQPWWPNYVKKNEYGTESGAWHWAVGQNRRNLLAMLDFALYGNPWSGAGGVERYLYMWTAAEQMTDRVFIPMEWVGQPMLGGYTVRNKIWPGYAVSYEKLGRDFAALVLDQGKDRLKIAMVNLLETPREGAFRVWKLDHGGYELTIGPDANDDGAMDQVDSTQKLTLARMDAVPVALPSRKLMIYELKQTKKLDSIYERPDLAMSPDDVKRTDDGLQITVHNIGAAPAPAYDVTLLDANGKVLASRKMGPLPAPLDLEPKTVTFVTKVRGVATVVLDAGNAVPEITKLNNRISLNK